MSFRTHLTIMSFDPGERRDYFARRLFQRLLSLNLDYQAEGEAEGGWLWLKYALGESASSRDNVATR